MYIEDLKNELVKLNLIDNKIENINKEDKLKKLINYSNELKELNIEYYNCQEYYKKENKQLKYELDELQLM